MTVMAVGKILAQGLLEYWKSKRSAKKERIRVDREVHDWLMNEQLCEKLNSDLRRRITTGKNPTTRINLPKPEGL